VVTTLAAPLSIAQFKDSAQRLAARSRGSPRKRARQLSKFRRFILG
jgi:hypothetical protein